MTGFRLATREVATTDTGHCTELLYDDGATTKTLLCAAHGGGIEPGTAETAIELATRVPEAACWARLGYDEEDAFGAWHTPSTAIDDADHPLLARIADRTFDTVVSLHGLTEETVLVGGAAPARRRETVATAIREVVNVPVETVDGGPYGGVSAANFVNWLSVDGGIQIEAGPAVRNDPAAPIRTALASLFSAGAL